MIGLVWRLLLPLGFIIPCGISANPVAYTDQAAYLQALDDLGLGYVHEGFENEAVWGSYRSSVFGFNVAASVDHLGVSWTSNFAAGNVTTSEGAAYTGLWGLFSYPHGSYLNPPPGADCSLPEECGDGFIGTATAGLFYGVGGWFDTNSPYAKVGLFLDGYPSTPVDFGETCDSNGDNCVGNSTIGTSKEFFGVIDTDGFSQFEFRELEGTLSDVKYLFADDFYIAGSVTAVPLPGALCLLVTGLAGLFGFAHRR